MNDLREYAERLDSELNRLEQKYMQGIHMPGAHRKERLGAIEAALQAQREASKNKAIKQMYDDGFSGVIAPSEIENVGKAILSAVPQSIEEPYTLESWEAAGGVRAEYGEVHEPPEEEHGFLGFPKEFIEAHRGSLTQPPEEPHIIETEAGPIRLTKIDQPTEEAKEP